MKNLKKNWESIKSDDSNFIVRYTEYLLTKWYSPPINYNLDRWKINGCIIQLFKTQDTAEITVFPEESTMQWHKGYIKDQVEPSSENPKTEIEWYANIKETDSKWYRHPTSFRVRAKILPNNKYKIGPIVYTEDELLDYLYQRSTYLIRKQFPIRFWFYYFMRIFIFKNLLRIFSIRDEESLSKCLLDFHDQQKKDTNLDLSKPNKRVLPKIESKPITGTPLGNLPWYVCVLSLALVVKIIKELNLRTVHGREWEVNYPISELLTLFKGSTDPEKLILICVSELEKLSLIKTRNWIGYKLPPGASISNAKEFCFRTDGLCRNWDLPDDAMKAIKLADKQEGKTILCETAMTAFNWDVRRINSVLTFMENKKLIGPLDPSCDGTGLWDYYFHLEPKAFSFVEEYELDFIIER